MQNNLDINNDLEQRKQKVGEGVCSIIQFVLTTVPCDVMRESITKTIAMTFWKNSSFAEHVLWETSGTCVDTKPRGIKATCFFSSDRGQSCINFYCKPRQWSANEATVISCLCVYENIYIGHKLTESMPRRHLFKR